MSLFSASLATLRRLARRRHTRIYADFPIRRRSRKKCFRKMPRTGSSMSSLPHRADRYLVVRRRRRQRMQQRAPRAKLRLARACDRRRPATRRCAAGALSELARGGCHEYVTRASIVEIFRNAGVPEDSGFFPSTSMATISGAGGARRIRPRLVVIEYNASVPPDRFWVMRYDAAYMEENALLRRQSSGTGIPAMKGYARVGTDSGGVNAFFVGAPCRAPQVFPSARPRTFTASPEVSGASFRRTTVP